LQLAPLGQVLLHLPQFALSLWTSTHPLPQTVSPEAHLLTHLP
jgi:hypothetical protein